MVSFMNVVSFMPLLTLQSTGYFWQVTDIHYDENYTLHGDPNSMCHSSASTIHYDLGT